MKSNDKLYSLCIIAAGCFWGVMGLFVRGLSAYGFDSLQITALRLVCGTAMLVLFALLRDRSLFRVPLGALPVFAAMGILSVLAMSWLYFTAIMRSTMSVAAILLYTAPMWVLAASVIFYGERLNVRKLAALALAFAGCVAVSGFSGGVVSSDGVLFGLGSGFAYALYSIIGKYALKKYTPITVTLYSFMFAAVGSIFICRPSEVLAIVTGAADLTMLLWIIGVGFVTVFAPYLLYTVGLSKTSAGKAAIMASAEPMVATLAGMIVFGEMPGISGILGIVMIISAIVLLNIGGEKSEKGE